MDNINTNPHGHSHSLYVKANYKVINHQCNCSESRSGWDFWTDFEHDPQFRYCPFCGEAIYREILLNNRYTDEGHIMSVDLIVNKDDPLNFPPI